jgi:hypothetical protein
LHGCSCAPRHRGRTHKNVPPLAFAGQCTGLPASPGCMSGHRRAITTALSPAPLGPCFFIPAKKP